MTVVNYTKSLSKSIQSWNVRLQRHIKHLNLTDYSFFTLFSIGIGVVSGLAAVSFHEAIHLLTKLFFQIIASKLFFLAAGAVIVLPAMGMLIQSLMIKFAPDVAKKKGVAEVIKAVATRGAIIPFRTTIFNTVASLICIGSGGTVGPEGPVAQLGAGVANKICNLTRLSELRRRVFTAVGAGSAIAAVFNTPLGGIFFALEVVLLNDFHNVTLAGLILASVSASAISRAFLGNRPSFVFPNPSVGPFSQLYLFIILGLIAGLISLGYFYYSNKINDFIKKRALKKMPQWLLMMLVGLLVGILGFFFHDVFGIGYAAINKLLAQSMTWKLALVLLIIKFFMVPLTLSSGGFGGTFAPALVMGASMGHLFVFSVNSIWGVHLDPITYILVGMGAVLGGIHSIPIASILIIFEMTQEYAIMLPLMLAVIISTSMVHLVHRGSIHLKHLKQQGFTPNLVHDTSILKSLQVKDVMRTGDMELLSENTPLPKIIDMLLKSKHSTFYTTDTNNKLVGTITENDLRPILMEYDHLASVVLACDIAKPTVTVVYPDDDLDQVLKSFAYENLEQLPVVASEDPTIVKGTIWWQDIITKYKDASMKFDSQNVFAQELKTIEKKPHSRVLDGFSIVERKAPVQFIGKTLAELRLRNQYGLEVLMIKSEKSPFGDKEENDSCLFPCSEYRIQPEDRLVLFGSDEKIIATSSWE
jgi:CIC family chloride channel protein